MESNISVKNWDYRKADLLYGIWAKNKVLLMLEDKQVEINPKTFLTRTSWVDEEGGNKLS